MIKITLPDGAQREYNEGVTSLEIAQSISAGLAKAVVAAEIDGQVWDLTRPITKDVAFKLLKFEDDNGKKTFSDFSPLNGRSLRIFISGCEVWYWPPN